MIEQVIGQLGDNLIPVVAISGAFIFLMFWICAATIDSIYKTMCNARLKERMVERGCSARDIEQVIRAGSNEEEWVKNHQPAPPVKTAEHYSVT